MPDKIITKTGVKQLPLSTDFNIVLLHGWGMNQGIWAGFSEQLATQTGAKVSCLDLPGFGTEHDTALSPYNIETMAQHIYQHLPNNCILVGWSLGGLVAQYIVSHFSGKVCAHIQICSSPKFAANEKWPGIQPEVLLMFSKQLQTNHAGLLKRFLAIQCMGLHNAKQRVREMMTMLEAFPLSSTQALSDSLSVLNTADLRQSMNLSTALPCLYIFGRLDSLVPLAAISDIQALAPSAQIEIIQKASHAPFISHPSETLTLITSFIKNLDSLN